MRLVPILAAAAFFLSAAGSAFAETHRPRPASSPAAIDSSMLDAARAKVAAGDTRGAIAGLAPYVADHPADVPAARLLGDLYFRVPDYARAERVWKAIARRPAGRQGDPQPAGLALRGPGPDRRVDRRVPEEPAQPRPVTKA